MLTNLRETGREYLTWKLSMFALKYLNVFIQGTVGNADHNFTQFN